jgi:hypothetical protein
MGRGVEKAHVVSIWVNLEDSNVTSMAIKELSNVIISVVLKAIQPAGL